ncbi:MAG: helix-turn-helix domain-containing protein [Clostridiales Family XIII bacterium]|jgi:transcriptional regulator with XRE-family HTH domain|nr:helix-turn-helix domain-containing protein [Clostridiales Family XIII bacterium]
MINFGERIKAVRLKKGMTQKTLSQLTGVREATLSRYEHNTRINRWIYLVRIADTLGTSVDYLLGRTDVAASIDEIQAFREFDRENDPVFSAYENMDDHNKALLMERAMSLYESRNENTHPPE